MFIIDYVQTSTIIIVWSPESDTSPIGIRDLGINLGPSNEQLP